MQDYDTPAAENYLYKLDGYLFVGHTSGQSCYCYQNWFCEAD